MEFNKPVSNPMMVGTIELLKAEDTPEHRQMFLDELQKAKFLSPVVIDPVPQPDEKGQVKIARDSKVQFPMLSTEDGRKFFMAFTDWTELKKWKDEENQQTFAMNFDDYAIYRARFLLSQKNGNRTEYSNIILSDYHPWCRYQSVKNK